MNAIARLAACVILVYALLFPLATAAHADWLVTRDGARIETEGAWEVEGRRVIFTLPNGTLSALRLSEVDLEKSRAATEEAKNPPPAETEAKPEAPKPEPVLVLTDKDIPKAATATATSEANEAEGSSNSPGGRAPALHVLDWRLEDAPGGVLVVGRLENGTGGLQSSVRLRVELRNEDGEVLATSRATLTDETLVAGGITAFQARFQGFETLPGEPVFLAESAESRRSRDEADETDS